ncbi:NAD(P)-dependent oxidoreductase [Methanomassiliicoccales archaeon LGM-DZ1]|nr:NAD(P)-dependent oxidoreductase [Methanomassiliicoccales archaeon LGM-DZ1]
MTGMRVAITGPTGAIGSELVELELAVGNDVIAIVRPGSKNLGNLPHSGRLSIIEADISDYASLKGRGKCDLFIHLAWAETFGAERDNAEIQIDNIKYSADAVRLAADWGAEAFVGTGSQAEYGPCDMKLSSRTPVNPESGYGIAKYAAGRMCRLLCGSLGIRFGWARVISVFGDRDADHTLIMYLIKSLLAGKTPELTGCDQIWDYIYAKDCAAALKAIGERGKDGTAYCIGSGKPRRLRDYVEAVRDIVAPGAELRFGVKPYYPHQPMMLAGDISELTEDTGFVPQYSFEEGIMNVLAYVRAHNPDMRC